MKKEVKRVLKFLDEIQWLFALQNYERTVTPKNQDIQNGEEVRLADVTLDEKYQTIHINLYPSFFKRDLKDQRKTLIHELCHTITLPLCESAESLLEGKLITSEQIAQISETATSKIENILDGFLKGNYSHFQKQYKEYLQ
ncbi:MAG: hypothetical protein WDN67_00540 [Candidatus Moraniibacteriota bacterium]